MSNYDFMGMVNDVNRRFNETELTEATFDTATGWHSFAKDSINSAIRRINQEEFFWPFNHEEKKHVLTAGTGRYSFPNDAKYVDMGSFRIKRNDTLGNETQYLRSMDYEDYLRSGLIDDEYNTSNTGIRKLPTDVIRTKDLSFVVNPVPDAAYELIYEYYRLPVDMTFQDDVPTVPEQFRYVIVDGAMYHAWNFKGSPDAAQGYENRFYQGIKDLRKAYINRRQDMKDLRTIRRKNYSSGSGSTSSNNLLSIEQGGYLQVQ